jgi:hypothetical protein
MEVTGGEIPASVLYRVDQTRGLDRDGVLRRLRQARRSHQKQTLAKEGVQPVEIRIARKFEDERERTGMKVGRISKHRHSVSLAAIAAYLIGAIASAFTDTDTTFSSIP